MDKKVKLIFSPYMTVEEFVQFFTRTVAASVNRFHPTEDHKYHVEDLAVAASIASDSFLYTIESIPWEITKKN
jgi:hypothetical protein